MLSLTTDNVFKNLSLLSLTTDYGFKNFHYYH